MKRNISIGLIFILVAATLVGCGGEKYEDGTYTGTGKGFGGDIEVEVEVKDGKISSVDVLEHSESDGIADPAIENIPEAIVEKNSTDVDAESGATLTSEGIIEAVNNALESDAE